MKVWALAYYDLDWKEPGIIGVYATREKAEAERQKAIETHGWSVTEVVECEVVE